MAGARSAAEALAVQRMTAARLPAFELNVPIVRGGVLIYEADVLWRALRAVRAAGNGVDGRGRRVAAPPLVLS